MSALTREFEIGYGTDGGGYSFEDARLVDTSHGFNRGSLLTYDGDMDYLGIEQDRGMSSMAIVDPHSRDLPSGYVTSEGDLSVATSKTVLWYESERECGCMGRPDPHEPGGWLFTGTYGDPSYPDCDRCGGPEDGDGYVTSPGCTMRLYTGVSDSFDNWHPVFHGLLVVAHAHAGHILEVGDTEGSE